MRTILVVTTLVFGAWCELWASRTAFGDEKADVQTKPLLVLTGANSRVEKAGYYRVASEEAWKKLWLDHLGKTEREIFQEQLPALTIDFERCMVIAIFQGAKTNSRGITVASVVEGNDAITLRFDDISYQTLGAGAQVTPYAFVVTPKSSKPVVLEEDVQSFKHRPPEWKERARLKAEEGREKR